MDSLHRSGSAGTQPVASGSEGLDQRVSELMCRSQVPGLSIAVVNRGGLVYSGGFGCAQLLPPAAATAHTRYPWFSMTKLVTATAALRLWDEQRLDLDAPIQHYLPSVPVGGYGPVTTRRLLTHTAGLANPLPVRWVHSAADSGPDPTEMVAGLLRRPRLFLRPPSGRARYSNVGYLIAGEIISTITGSPIQEALSRLVLEPLALADTSFGLGEEAAAVGYLNVPSALVPVVRSVIPAGIVGARHQGVRSLNPFLVDGAAYGGLVGPVLDVGRFLRLHLNDGELDGIRILSSSTATAMRTITAQGRPFDHAIGWFRKPAGAQDDYVEHYGTGAGFWNVARIYPDAGIGVAIMTNSTRPYRFNALMRYIRDAS